MSETIQFDVRCGPVNHSCVSCQSENQKKVTSEMAVHFPGIEGLKKPIVWMYPKILVCLDCGIAQFTVPEKELEVLQLGAPIEDAAVWLGGAASSQEQ